MSDKENFNRMEFTELGQTDCESLSTFNEWSVNSSELEDEQFSSKCSLNLLKIYFHTIKYSSGCIYLYIGDSDSKLENLSCSMKTPYVHEPLSTSIFSSSKQDASSTSTNDLACKLAKRLKKQVFVSLNVSFSQTQDGDIQNDFLKLIEIALFKEIKMNPHKF